MTTCSASARCPSTITGSNVVNSDKNSDKDRNNNNRMRSFNSDDKEGDRSWQRLIIEPLEQNTINAKKFRLLHDSIVDRKGYLNLQFLRVILNDRSKNQSQIRFYKAKDASKKNKHDRLQKIIFDACG